MTKKLMIIGLVLLFVSSVFAEVRVDWGGNLYNQFRWTNAMAGYGPHTSPGEGRDSERYGNFVRTEAQFEMNATVSQYVKVYLRIKTIFDSDDPGASNDNSANASAWMTYWDDTTGWFKLRGFKIDFMPPWEMVDQITLGTPMGLRFSRWFMADRRYIDRDNAKGIYVMGHFGEMKWNFIRMWQANWQGYNWGTGGFLAEDATYAINLNNYFTDEFYFALDGVMYMDTEFDPEDVDNPNWDGITDAEDSNGAMAAMARYIAYGLGISGTYDFSDVMGLGYNVMYTGQMHDEDSADEDGDNIVDDWADWWPSPKYTSVGSPSFIFTFNSTDPFDNGFSPKAQFFMIDENYISYWGSRREHDLLMIDGGIDGIRNVYGTRLGLQTFLWGGDQIGVRHEFRDIDFLRLGEGMVESPVGYMGGTFDFDFDLDAATVMGQFNYLTATNNTGGATDEEDDLYDGDGDMYLAPRDFSGMVGGLGVMTQVSGVKLGINVRYGNWSDGVDEDNEMDDINTMAMVIEPVVSKQLSPALNLELKPRYQTVVDEYGEDADSKTTCNDIVIQHKWVYNFGGLDFWLRGEHVIGSTETETDRADKYEYTTHTLHAAWEVKF
ncbi:MAG: hypothetical protein APR54_00685 [Candidatus Cloacimonas sp. SDB]|nr:MAG: hypothetical protein APR54_00685 [Candidatus Cloacimonas sp. SDB]